MNKQEAIEEIKNIETLHINDKIAGQQVDMVIKNQVLDIISQIDEPQKPVVPKFVADWVDNSREYSFDFDEWFDYENQPQKVYYWLNPENKRHAELNTLALVTLIVNGANAVEIEQEKLYTVEIPDPHGVFKIRYLFRNSVGNIRIGGTDYRDIFSTTETHLTEAEIKQDFEWAWQWAKEVE
mgnify:CR=1 FL=1